MNIEKLIDVSNKLDLAKGDYDKELAKFLPRAQEIAELMKELNMSLVLDNTNTNYKLFNRSCFRTKNDYNGLCANKINFSDDFKSVSYSCCDYENSEVGYYKILLEDFIKDNWKEYFTQIINFEIDLRKTEDELKSKENDYKEFLRLKEKLKL